MSVILIEPVAVFEFGVAVEVFGLDRRRRRCAAVRLPGLLADPGRCRSRPRTSPRSPSRATHGLDAVVGSDLVDRRPRPSSATGDDYPPEVLETLRDALRGRGHACSACVRARSCSAPPGCSTGGVHHATGCTSTRWLAGLPKASIDPRALYVDDGDIITSAGTAAGIDACLHLVRRELGTAIATKIARRMVVPPQRDGGQQQFVEMPIPECTADSLAPLLTWVLAQPRRGRTGGSLAKQAMMSDRTFARRFSAETGTTPHKWLTQQRILAARSLLEESDLGVEQIATRVGFNSAVVLREHFRREIGLAPVDYRRRFVYVLRCEQSPA